MIHKFWCNPEHCGCSTKGEHAAWCSASSDDEECWCRCLYEGCTNRADFEDLVPVEEDDLLYWTQCCSAHKTESALPYDGPGKSKLHP
jgi:hypothetical protein